MRPESPLPETKLQVGEKSLRLQLVRHPRARRYVLRLCREGFARVSMPPWGSRVQAMEFALKNLGWLEQQLLRQAAQPTGPKPWLPGTEILFRGERVRLERRDGQIHFGTETLACAVAADDLRPRVEQHLWQLATRELPARVLELASLHNAPVRRVSVRNQRSRWGSCSRRGTVSLNWRLIQAPALVRDYLILHELAHFKEMNHSRRFWNEVARICPEFEQAEKWLKQHSKLLR